MFLTFTSLSSPAKKVPQHLTSVSGCPFLLALSSNSPFWHGTDTSYRLQAWSRWPSARPTEIFHAATAHSESVVVWFSEAAGDAAVKFDRQETAARPQSSQLYY